MDWKEQLAMVKDVLFPDAESPRAADAAAASAPAGHRFERHLRGGWVPDWQLYIPETIVRSLDLCHGDLIGRDESGRIFVVERKGESIPRVEVRFGILEGVGEDWVVRSFVSPVGGKILPLYHGGRPLALRFPKGDEWHTRLRLEEECLVDAAFWENRPDKAVIVYRHFAAEGKPETFAASGKERRKLRCADAAEGDAVTEEEGRVVFGKRILIVGGEVRHRTFSDRITQFGGEAVTLPGDIAIGNGGKLEREIEKADVVLLMARMIRHQTLWDGVAACRRLKKPHWVVESMGIKSVFLGVSSALGQEACRFS